MDWQLLLPTLLFYIGFVLHMIGCVLLCVTKIQVANQRKILIHLSVVEMLLSFFVAVNFTMLYYLKVQQWRYVELFSQTLFGFLHKCFMFYLLIDRVMDIYFHLSYPIICSQGRVTLALFTLWILNIIGAIVTVAIAWFHRSYIDTMIKSIYFYTVTDFLILLMTICCFSYLYLKVRHIVHGRRSRTTYNHDQHTMRLMRKKFLLPCLIVCTYILFNSTGVAVLTIRTYLFRRSAFGMDMLFAARVLLALGLITDSIVYVFFQPQVRNLLKRSLISSSKSLDSMRASYHVTSEKSARKDTTTTVASVI